jgi:hypothetical protein
MHETFAPTLFPPADRLCESYQWWTRSLDSAAEPLAVNQVPAW